MDEEYDNGFVTLTPPISDAESDEELVAHPEQNVLDAVCFHCLGEVNVKNPAYHTNSYLRSRYLENVFEDAGNRYGPAFQRFKIFGHIWDVRMPVLDNLDILSPMLRQEIGCIQSKVTSRTASLDHERNEINRCLEFILIQVRNNYLYSSDRTDNERANGILREMHTILNHIGRITEIPQLTINSLTNKGSGLSCYIHLHLDVYWRILCIVHIIQNNYPDAVYSDHVCDMDREEHSLSVFDQVLHVILWDLVTIGQLRFNNMMKGVEYRKVSLFPCTCVQELWVLCIKLSQLRTRELNGQPFWSSLHSLIRTVSDWKREDEDVLMEADDCCVITNPPAMFDVEDSTSLCLWIVSNLTPLVKENNLDVNKTTDVYVSNYQDLEMILNKCLTNPNISESSLKRHLHSCLYITSLWVHSTKLLNILWDYFYRRLNDTFQDSSSKVDGLACVDKTICGFYNRCQKLTTGYDESVEKETSFHLFLRIFSQHLQKLYKGDDTREWKQLKGRIYSKFYPRRIQGLTDCGLYNLTCMFLTLGLTTNLTDLATKLCDFYDMVDFEHITMNKRLVIWRGAFTLMMVCEDRQLDTSFVGERMASALEHCVSELKDADSTKHRLWDLVRTYLEGTQDLVDRSLSLSKYKLIGPGISMLLPICSESQLRHVLSVIQSLLNKIRQVSERTGPERSYSPLETEQHTEFAERLWKHVYRYIVDRSKTLTPPVEMADIAAEFCLLALKFPPPTSSKESFLTVFQTFASVETINSSIACRFLGHLLGSSEVTTRLESDLENWEPFVIKCWFQCCVLVPSPSDILEHVTRSVLQLGEVKSIFQQAGFEIPYTMSEVPVLFLKALHQAHGNIKSWPEKMAFQQKIIPFFVDLHKCCIQVLRNIGPCNILSNMYYTVGNMMKYCAKLVYIRQDPIVPAILSSMILPQQAVDKDKPPNPTLLAAIRDHLHLFVQGLGRLGYERDLYVQRKLKEIIVTYLPKFTLRPSSNPFEVSNATTVHPLVSSLAGTFIQQPSQEAIKFRHYVIQVVIDNFLVVKNMAVHPLHSTGWLFLRGVVEKTINTQVLARDFQEVLLLCLEYSLLLPEDSAAFPNIMYVLQRTAEAHISTTEIVPMSKVTEVCQSFIKTYSRWSIQGVLKVMGRLAILHKQAVVCVVQDLSKSVQEMENKRGVGTDQVLRKKYYQLLQTLGEKGEEEKTRLQSMS